MKKIFKYLGFLLLFVMLALGYMLFIKKTATHTPIEYVPNDAVYILETDNLTSAWKHVVNTNIWKHIIADKSFDYLQDTDKLLNLFLLESKLAKTVLKGRPLTMSAHMIGAKTYDFLYIVDLKSISNLSFLLEKLLQQASNYTLKKLKNNTFELVPKVKKDATIYIKILDNLLVVSLDKNLIQKPHKQDKSWLTNLDFQKVSKEIDKDELLNFYVNYSKIPAYAAVYMDAVSSIKLITDQLDYAAFDLNQDDERITMNGYTKTKDAPSYFNALLDAKPGKLEAHRIISDKMALYLAIGFKNYKVFYQSVLGQFANTNKETVIDYRKNIRKVENFFAIDLNQDLFDWIGTEIALVNVQNKANRPTDVLAIIHTESIADAKKGLEHIATQIRKKSPFKFKKYSYHNYEINYLHNKGFFELIFSKLFKKIQKPYFTYVEDFVVFSNSEMTLKLFIDDYVKGHTLSHNEKFMDFKSEFSSKATFSMFIQTPKLYANLLRDASSASALKEKEQVILSFNRIGFQLKSANDLFETQLIIDHDSNAPKEKQMNDLLLLADDAINRNYFEYVQFKTILADTVSVNQYTKYYDSGQLALEGTVVDGKPDGLWRAYYPSGNTKYAIHYDDGKVDGEANFYYDTAIGNTKATTNYDNDFIAGSYTEYYKNGNKKVSLEYDNGVLHGDAKYYYISGQLKLEGEYKKGQKKGKWIYFDANGKRVKKVRY